MLLLLLLPLVAAMPFDLASELATQVTYDENFARNKMMPLAAAAYSSNPQQCLSTLYKNAQMKRLTSVVCDITLIDKCTGFTAVNHDDKAIIISFRGTDRNIQLIMEGDETLLKNNTKWAAGGVVSLYFSDGFKRVWMSGIKDDLATLQSQNPGYELWVPYAFRVTHSHDMVPHLPLENQEGYYHHKTEAYYKKGMAAGAHYYVCYDMGESTFCSDGNLADSSIKDHLHYFEKDVSEYGDNGCK
ncbi:triacylglycerol lipase [Ancylostoma caninum]|uniref:Triacylglycerol lipase n=1 Tax=Ancylostoma caninum TaxID=29170 RepID=A0A368GCQ9_ANCCA|nr:triacylglycerol lipase [Ancylostoma caninum]